MSTIELPALYVDSVALVVTTPRLVLVNRDPSRRERCGAFCLAFAS